MFPFLHLSDLHISSRKDSEVYGIKPYRKLEAVVESICDIDTHPAFVLITGDISYDGTVESYHLVKNLLQKIESGNIPVYFALGNHDNRINFRKVFENNSTGPYYHCFEHDPLRVIVLDSYRTGTRYGYFDGDQFAWLEKTLSSEPDRPTVIAFHHTLKQYQPEFDVRTIHESHQKQFFETIQDRNVIGILNGHLHFNQSAIVNGVLNVMVGSTGAELSYNDTEYSIIDTSCYNVVFYREGSLFIKTIYVPCKGGVLTQGPIERLVGIRT